MTDAEGEHLRRWATLMNRRGHASAYARETEDEKKIVELDVAVTWVEAVRQSHGLVFSGPAINPEEPPDIWADHDGQRVGIELAELVNSSILRKTKHANAGKELGDRFVTSCRGRWFYEAQWDETRFGKALNQLIEKKARNYEGKGITVDFLVVYTAENWLLKEDVARWLQGVPVKESEAIGAVFFMMDYHPGEEPGYPVFRVY